jgi:hypothetical protein
MRSRDIVFMRLCTGHIRIQRVYAVDKTLPDQKIQCAINSGWGDALSLRLKCVLQIIGLDGSAAQKQKSNTRRRNRVRHAPFAAHNAPASARYLPSL